MAKIKAKFSILRRKLFFYVIWPLAFAVGSLFPADDKLVLFAFSKNYSSMPDNMTGLYSYLNEKGFDCRVMQSPSSSLKRIFAGIAFEFYYARCKCVFVTDNFDPLYAHKPSGQTKVIQLWHACGAFKKWGYSTLDLAWGGSRENQLIFPKHNTYTDVMVSAESVIPCYAEAFGCSESIIKPMGTPRTDVFFNSEFVSSARQKVCGLFPEIGNRKIILYAPTFRGNSPEEAYNDNVLDYRLLKEKLGQEYALLLKFHPFTAKKYSLSPQEKSEYGDFVFEASDLPADTALCAADLLIADYSSLIFEYSLLGRPMLFYAYDLEKYKRDRSFYYEYEKFVPGRIVASSEETVNCIIDGDFRLNRVAPFRKVFMSACDGKSTERIAEYAVE